MLLPLRGYKYVCIHTHLYPHIMYLLRVFVFVSFAFDVVGCDVWCGWLWLIVSGITRRGFNVCEWSSGFWMDARHQMKSWRWNVSSERRHSGMFAAVWNWSARKRIPGDESSGKSPVVSTSPHVYRPTPWTLYHQVIQLTSSSLLIRVSHVMDEIAWKILVTKTCSICSIDLWQQQSLMKGDILKKWTFSTTYMNVPVWHI